MTWGLPLTLCGAIAAVVLLITGRRPKTFHGLICFEIGNGWGGFNAGAFFFVCKDATESTKRHEAGHGLQNIIFGVFMPFVVTIPSVIRYWYREYLVRYKGVCYWDLPDYDAIWFEGWATQLGEKYFKNNIQGGKNNVL